LTVASRLEVIPLEQLVTDATLHSAWRRLASDVPDASYFQTPDWIVSWWETVGDRPSGTAALVSEGSRLTGLFALAKTKERLTGRLPWQIRVISNAGSGSGTDHAGWLAIDGAETALAGWLRTMSPILLKGIPLKMGESLDGRLVEMQRCPRVMISDAPDLMSGKLAKTLRNAQRRLAREGIEFSWKGPGEVEAADLEMLYHLNELRRSDTGDNPVFDAPQRRAFHERMLDWGDEGGGTALLMAARGDDVVGVLYGFRWRDTFAYYQIGWDPEYRQLSLGSVLVMEAIDECSRQGIAVFDFLRGTEDYKYRFGATDLLEGTFVVGRSPGLAAIEATHRLRERLRSKGS